MPEHKLTLDDVRHVAKLARLALPDEKLAQFSTQLTAIVQYIDTMAQVDTNGVEPMAQPLPVHNVFRDDTPGDPLPLEKTLQNAPDADAPFFKVPKVIGGDEDSAG
jgi:aspartyl-tRNA(Asn)/glutamyl-tRNA(Gln) amidotransferase subunit C